MPIHMPLVSLAVEFLEADATVLARLALAMDGIDDRIVAANGEIKVN
jgi:hypothetical protein